MRIKSWIWTFAVLAALGTQGSVMASDRTRGGGGEGQPDPLALFNEHAELADGELYLLVGRVIMAPALQGSSGKLQPYLDVDFSQHPWLAGKKRKAAPLYLIEGSASAWRSLEGQSVKLAARARVQLFYGHSDSPQILFSLRVIPELSTIPLKH